MAANAKQQAAKQHATNENEKQQAAVVKPQAADEKQQATNENAKPQAAVAKPQAANGKQHAAKQ